MKDTTKGRTALALVTDALGVIGGIWLIASPYLLGYDTAQGIKGQNATTMGLIAGIAAIVLSLVVLAMQKFPALEAYRLPAGIAFIGLGLLLMSAPYLFNYAILGGALWNLQITGGIFVLIAGFTTQALLSKNETEFTAS